jgi:late competence protein required for DNA uptake (superfamily II DNA/RNA helicase)
LPNRYKLKITNYYYNFVLNRFQKNYHLDIQIIQNIIHNKESIECLICYEMKKNNIYKTNCNHYYCMECYENWYTQNEKHECAYCRQSVYAIDKLMEKL